MTDAVLLRRTPCSGAGRARRLQRPLEAEPSGAPSRSQLASSQASPAAAAIGQPGSTAAGRSLLPRSHDRVAPQAWPPDTGARRMTDDASAPQPQTLRPWQKGGPSPNYRGRGKGHLNKFSQQLVADFAADWREHGAAAIARLREESVVAYVKIATSLVPRELLLQVSRPLVELSDDELQAAALAERDQATMLIEHIRLRGGAELVEAAQREVLGEDEEDDD